MTPAPNPSPQERVRELIALTERLTALISAQARAFEARRPQDAAATVEETGKLANVYRREAATVRADPSFLKAVPAELRKRLLQATEAFDAVMARQDRALYAAKVVTEGLVHAIAQEVAAQRTRGAAYGPKGTRAGAAAVTAVTLNQRA